MIEEGMNKLINHKEYLECATQRKMNRMKSKVKYVQGRINDVQKEGEPQEEISEELGGQVSCCCGTTVFGFEKMDLVSFPILLYPPTRLHNVITCKPPLRKPLDFIWRPGCKMVYITWQMLQKEIRYVYLYTHNTTSQ
jgi:hypothetical protein